MAVKPETPRVTKDTLPPGAARHAVLGVNPADLSETTVGLLSAWSRMKSPPVPVLAVTAGGRLAGWLVPVRPKERPGAELPPDLTACMDFAARGNCAYIRFDGIFAPDPELRNDENGRKPRKKRK